MTDDLRALAEEINAGAQIPTIEAAQIEQVWEALSRIPVNRRKSEDIGFTGVCVNPALAPKNAEEEVALMARYALLNALLERGFLNDHMNDESARKRVFVAAATLPCDTNDLGEALAERLLCDKPADVVERTREELKNAGWDLNRPKVVEKFVSWIHNHC